MSQANWLILIYIFIEVCLWELHFLGLIIDTYIELKFDTDKCITITSDDSFFNRMCVSHQAKK